MQAIILAGGRSLPLNPITEIRPKVLVPLLNIPLLKRTIDWLPDSIDEVFVTCNYRAKDIQNFVEKNKKQFRPKVEVTVEDRKLGSAGAVKNIQDKLEGDFLIISGDIMCSLEINKLIEFHNEKKSDFTIALFSVPHPQDYGIISIDKDGKINRLVEKPKQDLVFSTLTNTGIYVSNDKMLEYVPRLSFYDFSTELLPYILKKGFEVHGFPFRGFWMDLGIPERLLEGHRMLLRKRMEFEVGEDNLEARLLPPLLIGKQCQLSGVVGPEVSIGDRVTGLDVKVTNSVIYDDVKMGRGVIIHDSIVCPGCKVGDNAIIEGAVLADGCKVANGVKISRNAKVWPAEKVKKDVGEGQLVGAPEK